MLINNKVYFIHIPRTAGRFLFNLLELNNQTIEVSDFSILFRGKESPHLTYPEHCLYTNHRSLERFCIVRDPVDRFISMIKGSWLFDQEKIDKMFSSQSYFDETVSNLCLNVDGNWFIPQINFIDYKTKIWRFEDNLDNKFFDWLWYNFNIKIIKFNDKHNAKVGESNRNDVILNSKQIGYIKDYYYKDYKILNY